jgi:hypothetical protein
MRIPTLALCLTLLLSPLGADADAADPGPKSGFREFKWGDRPSKKMFSHRTKRAGMDVYSITDDDRRVAFRDAGLILYHFYRNGLCEVEVIWKDTMSLSDFMVTGRELAREWGTPDRVDKSHSHEWLSRNGETEATLLHIPRHESDPRGMTDLVASLVIHQRKCYDEAGSDVGL